MATVFLSVDKQVQRWILFHTCMERTKHKCTTTHIHTHNHTHTHIHNHTQPHTYTTTHTHLYIFSTRYLLMASDLFVCVVYVCALVTHVLTQLSRLDKPSSDWWLVYGHNE